MNTPLTAPDPPSNRATRIIRGQQVRWRGRPYTATWMAAHAQCTVRIRPRGPDTVDVYDAATGQQLGTAHVQPTSHLTTPTPPR